MNFNSSEKQFNLHSINSESNYNNTDTKKKTNEKDYNIFNSVNISKSSQEMRNKYYENSEIKSKTNNNNNNNEYDSSNNNTFKLSYKKYTFSSFKSIPENNPNSNQKIDKNPFQLKSTSINNSNYSKINYKPEIYYPTELITNYQFWTGANYFPFKAKIIEGPSNFKPTLMTGTAITIGTLLFLIFESDYLNDEITVFIPILISILYLLIIVLLIIASFCDPGIIRKFYINKQLNNKERDNQKVVGKIFHLGHIMSYKYCYTCGIIRPNRSTHCSECNNCVERLDHHCPWMGNCAGKRNYIYFFIFLTLLNILQILMIIFCIIHIVQKVKDFSDLNKKLPPQIRKEHITAFSFCEVIMSVYLIIFNLFFIGFTTPLILYHINLILTDTTTKEKLRNAFYHGNPFSRNKWQNMKNVLFPTIKKYSILDILRGDYKEICDNKETKDNENKRDTKEVSNQKRPSNDSNFKLNLKDIMDNNINENKMENNETNLGLLNISETKVEQENIKQPGLYLNNKPDIIEINNTNKNLNSEPEPLDTVIEDSLDKGKEMNSKFLANSTQQIRDFVEHFRKKKKYNAE